jgi:HSP20 family protein
MASDTRHKHEKAGGAPDIIHRTSSDRPDRHDSPRRGQASQYPSAPFGFVRQMQDEMERWFNRFGAERNWTAPSNWPSNWTSPSAWMARAGEQAGDWMPAIDAFQRGNEFVIRADVPGMARTDLTVEIGEDSLTIRGERKHEDHGDQDGVFWSERSHGTFSRVVPLPPGAISDSAKASFTNGVLEVVVQAPSQEARRGRKVDISGQPHDETTKK